MPSASLHFRLPQDQRDFDVASSAGRYLAVIQSLDTYLRNRIKYADVSEDAVNAYQAVRDELHRELSEQRVEID
jgi:hypothetical protein